MPELAGADAPVVDQPVVEQATPAPDAPADQANAEAPEQEQALEKPERTYTEAEHRKTLQERLGREKRSLEKRLRAEIERDYLKQQLETRDRPETRRPATGEPKVEDFKVYEDFVVAKAKYEFRQEQADRERESAAQRNHREALQRADRMREKIAAASEEFPDIEDVANGEVPFTEPMVAFFEESDHAARLIHHLGTNVKEAARIAELSPAAQFRELVKLESKFTAPPRTTNAPAPIVPSNAKVSTKSRSEMTDSEWLKDREREIREKTR